MELMRANSELSELESPVMFPCCSSLCARYLTQHNYSIVHMQILTQLSQKGGKKSALRIRHYHTIC